MRVLAVVFLAILILVGCQDAKQKEQTRVKEIQKLKLELKSKDEQITALKKSILLLEGDTNTTLSRLGFHMSGEKIIIDTNKTKNYLKELNKRFKKRVTKLSREIKDGVVNEKDVGLEANSTTIKIDLKKTKNTLEKFKVKFEEIFEDILNKEK